MSLAFSFILHPTMLLHTAVEATHHWKLVTIFFSTLLILPGCSSHKRVMRGGRGGGRGRGRGTPGPSQQLIRETQMELGMDKFAPDQVRKTPGVEPYCGARTAKVNHPQRSRSRCRYHTFQQRTVIFEYLYLRSLLLVTEVSGFFSVDDLKRFFRGRPRIQPFRYMACVPQEG